MSALDPVRRLWAVSFVDLNDDYRRSILIAGSGRSGSTWLAQLVNHRNEYRLIFEPLRRDRSGIASCIPYGLYLDPSQTSGVESRAVEAVLRGRVRNSWSNWHNRRRVARRRIVKEIRATNLTPWIHTRFPDLPIVYLLRHPVPVAASWTRLGWPDYLDEFVRQEALMSRFSPVRPLIDEVVRTGRPFERHVLRWCLENAIPLEDLRPGDAYVLFYERLVADPAAELPGLFRYLGKPFAPSVLEVVDIPSPLSYPGTPTTLDERDGERALEITSAFGLDRVYGADRDPRIEASRVLSAT